MRRVKIIIQTFDDVICLREAFGQPWRFHIRKRITGITESLRKLSFGRQSDLMHLMITQIARSLRGSNPENTLHMLIPPQVMLLFPNHVQRTHQPILGLTRKHILAAMVSIR